MNPFALVSTVAPPILAVFTLFAVLPEAGALAELDDPEAPELPGVELPQAATARVAAAKALAAHHLLRIAYLHSDGIMSSQAPPCET